MTQQHTLSRPCGNCAAPAGTPGWIERRGFQDCVYCSACGKSARYNAPKTETGREVISLTTVHNGIKPAQRARILLRANGRCELCGANGEKVVLQISHYLSAKHGLAAGMSLAEINDDENLGAMCAECNSGIGEETVPLRLVIAIALQRIRNRVAKEASA